MKKGKLLIVDDEIDLLKSIKILLEDLADSIELARDGQEAIEILSREEFQCVICDINMPRKNGVEVIAEMRRQGNNVPFIFYTAHGNRELMLEVVKYGPFDFLDKPNLDGLEEVVSRGLKHGLAQGQGVQKDQAVSEAEYLSEYHKLLNSLDEK